MEGEWRASYARSVPGTALFVLLALGHLALSLYYFSLTGIRLLTTGAASAGDWHGHGLLFCIQAGLFEFLLGALSLMGVLPTVRPSNYQLLGAMQLLTALYLIPLMSGVMVGLVAIILAMLAWPLIFPESAGAPTCLRPITHVKASEEANRPPEPASEPEPVPPAGLAEETIGSVERDEPSLPRVSHYAPTPFLPPDLINGSIQRQNGNGGRE